MCQRQPKAIATLGTIGAAGFCPVKAAKNMGHVFFADTRPGITDLEAGAVVAPHQTDPHRRTWRAVLERVINQYNHQLGDHFVVAMDNHRAVVAW